MLEPLVSEGDVIAKDQAILDGNGQGHDAGPFQPRCKILKIHVKAGQSVPVGAVLITVEGTAAASAPAAKPAAPAAAAQARTNSCPAPAPVALSPRCGAARSTSPCGSGRRTNKSHWLPLPSGPRRHGSC
ncbi:MAG: hypothetical protein U0894_15645 [Pirellulales bacterium]